MKRKVIFLFLISFMITGAGAFADTITLKNGTQIEAQIIENKADSVIVDVEGIKMPYYLEDIEKINGVPVKQEQVQEASPAAEPVMPQQPAPAQEQPKGLGPEAAVADSRMTSPVQDQEPVGEPEVSAPQPDPDTEDLAKRAIPGRMAHKRAGAIFSSIMVAGLLLVFVVIIYIYCSLCLYLIAKKTNDEPAWLAWIPIASLFLMCKVAKVNYLWLLLVLASFIPIVGTLCMMGLMVYLWYKISEARNKPGWLGVLVIIPLVSFVIMGYLAFSE